MSEYFIPMSEILSYCELIYLRNVDDRLSMAKIITTVDAALLSFRASRKAKSQA